VYWHVFAHLRPNRKTTALSPIRASMQLAKLPLPRMPTSYSTLSRLLLPHSPPRSPKPSLALSSIAAPTTASAFLQASLSKMPRSNFSPPQHPAPRHFRSRLTTSRTSGLLGVRPHPCVLHDCFTTQPELACVTILEVRRPRSTGHILQKGGTPNAQHPEECRLEPAYVPRQGNRRVR
jgi:hypothetical protein